MDFRFQAEPLPGEIRRIVSEQIDAAVAELGGETGEPREIAVHEGRKRFKRIRAVVRLARDELGERVYARENAAYRGIGRRLAGIRDARVLVNTLDALDAEGFAGVRTVLVERHAAAADRAAEAGAQAISDLRAARERIAYWPLRRDAFAALEGGLARVYRQGRRRRARAYEIPDEEHFHEWRKRVKDLWHVLQLLEPVWPPVLTVAAEQAHELSDCLGDEHDLSVLAQSVERDRLGSAGERASLIELIAARQRGLRAAARPLGARLYAEKPADFADRMRAYWAAWRDHDPQVRQQSEP
jgi:CHAD domain-containing protein